VNIVSILHKDGTRALSPKGKSSKKEKETETKTTSPSQPSETQPTTSQTTPASSHTSPNEQTQQQLQSLNEQITDKAKKIDQLSEQVKRQEEQLQTLQKQIEELGNEKRELKNSFEGHKKESEEKEKENQAQIEKLEQDIAIKVRKIEKLTKERDSERRAKEVAKQILSSNGPKPVDAETMGSSFAIRMGSLENGEPLRLAEIKSNSELNSSTELKASTELKSSSEISAPSSTDGARSVHNHVKAASSPRDIPNLAQPGPLKAGGGEPIKVKKAPTNPRWRRSLARDDMDIASEAERARVRRLVQRWEEMKLI